MNLTELEKLVPKTNMQAWYAASSLGLTNGASVSAMTNKTNTGNHNLACGASQPTFVTNVINGLPAVRFSGSGSSNPLATTTGGIVPKHIFVVAGYDGAAFPAVSGVGEYAGLISAAGAGSVPVLIGNPSSTRFYDNNYDATDEFHYYHRGLELTESTATASFNNALSIFEVSFVGGWSLDNIQIGKDRTFANRVWKGDFCEALFYSTTLSNTDRYAIYEYLAMKYLLYKRNSAGLDVWPFQADWGDVLGKDKRVLSSTSVSGANKSRSKSSAKRAIAPRFTARFPEEYDAAESFWDSKYPATHFIYRDYTTSAETDTECRFVSGISKSREDYRDVDYEWQAVEV